jgi:predicted ArsR family transcriptional regulator
LLYRLTAKAQDLFPQADNALSLSLLDQARKLFGPGAPEKMLYLHFQEKAAGYAEKVKGDLPAERAASLARLRDREGHMAECAQDPLRLIERHHPMLGLFEVYPAAADMERDVMQRVLGVSVRREVTRVGGNYEAVFFLA